MFKSFDGRAARYSRKVIQELIQDLTAFEIIEERLKRHPRTAKNRSTS